MTEYIGFGPEYYVTKHLGTKQRRPCIIVPKDWVEFKQGDLVEISIRHHGSEFWIVDSKPVGRIAQALAVSIDANFGFKPGDLVTVKMRRYLPATGSGNKDQTQEGA